jgi:hypothetical protein
MANTVNTENNFIVTLVPQTGSDVGFTFNSKTYKAYLQCDADTTSIYFVPVATGSSGNAPWKIPTVNKQPPFILDDTGMQGMPVTFNGTVSTNVQIIEFLRSVS